MPSGFRDRSACRSPQESVLDLVLDDVAAEDLLIDLGMDVCLNLFLLLGAVAMDEALATEAVEGPKVPEGLGLDPVHGPSGIEHIVGGLEVIGHGGSLSLQHDGDALGFQRLNDADDPVKDRRLV